MRFRPLSGPHSSPALLSPFLLASRFTAGAFAFGTDAVIDESLERATDPSLKPAGLSEKLKVAIDTKLPESLNDAALRIRWRSGSS